MIVDNGTAIQFRFVFQREHLRRREMERLSSNIRHVGVVLGVFLVFAVVAAHSQCELEIVGPSPLFAKQFGSHKFVFRAKQNEVSFKSGETLTAHCSNVIQLHSRYSSPTVKKSVQLFCSDNSMFYEELPQPQRSEPPWSAPESHQSLRERNVRISCDDSTTFNLYESVQKLPNCVNFTTYGIGINTADAEDIVVAGVCYDFATLSLKYASYVAERSLVDEPASTRSRVNKLNIDLTTQLEDLSSYFSFMSTEKFEKSWNEEKLSKPLLRAFTFDYESLLQDSSVQVKLSGFSYIFNTMWWRHLRLGNWRFYMEALTARVQDVTYMVHTGTHGRISIPAIENNCNKNTTLAVGPPDARVYAPAYIWSYIKSLEKGIAEEFVVIAHNSPYVEEPSSHPFCTDMCDEIEWLRNSDFGRMRRKAMLGYAFCCRPAEVAAIIDNFPFSATNNLVQKSTTTTITMILPDSEEYDW